MSWSGNVATRAIHGVNNRTRSRTGSFGSSVQTVGKLPKRNSEISN